jgi:hypothetical protein
MLIDNFRYFAYEIPAEEDCKLIFTILKYFRHR